MLASAHYGVLFIGLMFRKNDATQSRGQLRLPGVGVAFKIYYIMAWRAGKTGVLQSALTRAVVFSAMTNAVAFGSMGPSNHPGMSSMGKLMTLSLVCTPLKQRVATKNHTAAISRAAAASAII